MKRIGVVLWNLFVNIMGLALLLAFFSLVYLHTDDGKQRIRSCVEKNLSKHLSMPLTIEKIKLESLRSFHLHGIEVLLPSGMRMQLDSVCLRGDFLTPFFAGDFFCEASGINLPNLPTLKLKVDAQFRNQTLTLQGVVAEAPPSTPLARIEAKIPLSTGWGVPYAIDMQAPMHANLSAAVPLAPFVNPFVSETLFIDGQIEVTATASGSAAEPVIAGCGSLSQGTCESLVSGALFQSIEAQLQIAGSTLEIETFMARDAHAGAISGNGAIGLTHDLPFHFNILLQRAALLHCDLAEGIFSGPLVCRGSRLHTDLFGNLDCEKLEIFLPEHRPKEIGAVEVVYINQTEVEPPPTKSRRSTNKSSLFYDLHIRNQNGIAICGNGLTSQWKGDLAISGPANAPLLDGEWRLSLGEYLFNGKKWALSQGTISLKGEEGNKSSLYAVAKLNGNAIPIEVIVKGAFGDLSLDFRSSPPMTQKEILCHILFGCDPREMTPFQGAELAKSINKLQHSSAFEGTDILTKIRNSFGFIDRIDFVQGSGGQAGDFSIKVGSYVLPHLFVGVKKNLTSNVNGIEIEADLLRNVKLQAEFGDDSDKQIHLKWKRDY